LVSPVEIQPVEEVRRALRLFDGELQQAAIDLHYDVGQSYQDLQVDWVLLDPTRLLQILINLLTNAIKCKRIISTLFFHQVH
jgi:signal transduction histidine kinase